MQLLIPLCLALLLSIQPALAQIAEIEEIETTIANYLEGSSYNKLDQLESAFSSDATLYLKMRDGNQRLTPQEYVAVFKGRTPGEYNGRVGNLLSIDVYKDVATAKAEILFPESGMRYVDLFLLKKLDDVGWRIISKTATRTDDGG